MGLPSAQRMTRSGQYAEVRVGGIARSGRLMTVAFLIEPELPGVRFGFTLTKKLGNAVKRNKLRRRLREIARHAAPFVVKSGRVVTIPRPAAVGMSFSEIESEWKYLMGKLSLLPPRDHAK